MVYDDFPDGYTEEKLLGQGLEAKVYLYKSSEGDYLAVKKYNLGYTYNNEWNIVRRLQKNSSLLKYYGIKDINSQQYLLIEYYQGITLKSYFEEYFTHPEDITDKMNNLITSSSKCLFYLVMNGIFHSDLASRKNILVNRGYIINDVSTPKDVETYLM